MSKKPRGEDDWHEVTVLEFISAETAAGVTKSLVRGKPATSCFTNSAAGIAFPRGKTTEK
jgi:hypothetical protein